MVCLLPLRVSLGTIVVGLCYKRLPSILLCRAGNAFSYHLSLETLNLLHRSGSRAPLGLQPAISVPLTHWQSHVEKRVACQCKRREQINLVSFFVV
mmetsp:Transcript_9563/g.14397  ORF Transcript_9563/g.14397 Transcript_9563/m.14397 type:complete len:96 (-) Transcript_9563:161-448(-)